MPSDTKQISYQLISYHSDAVWLSEAPQDNLDEIPSREFPTFNLTSEALVMLVATELRVGDIADDATSDGLAVILLNRDWNINGKLLLDPGGPEEYSDPWF